MSLTPAEAERIAAQLYGFNAIARPLPGEFDDNFQLTLSNGAQYALKVMRADCDRDFLEMQLRALKGSPDFPSARVASGQRNQWPAGVAFGLAARTGARRGQAAYA